MPDDQLFVQPDALFGDVEAVRRAFRGVGSADGLAVVSLSNASATETLTTAVGLAAAVHASIGSQLELIARSITLGALRAIEADSPESED